MAWLWYEKTSDRDGQPFHRQRTVPRATYQPAFG